MEANPFLRSPIIFFLSRLLILAGMVIFCTTLSLALGMFLSRWIFGVDLMSDPAAFSNYSDPATVNALKLVQVISVTGAFLLPALSFPKAIQQVPSQFLKVALPRRPLSFVLAIVIMGISLPFVSWLVYENMNLKLPASMADLEQRLKATELEAQRLTEAFTIASTPSVLLLNLFVLGVIPAITEEFLFRGVLLQFIRFCFGNIHFAVIASGIIFSLVHWQFYGFVPRAVLGILLGYIFVYSGSIWPCVLVHFVNNTLVLLNSWYHWDQQGIRFLQEDYVAPWYIILASGAATMALLAWMSRWKEVQPGYVSE